MMAGRGGADSGGRGGAPGTVAAPVASVVKGTMFILMSVAVTVLAVAVSVVRTVAFPVAVIRFCSSWAILRIRPSSLSRVP